MQSSDRVFDGKGWDCETCFLLWKKINPLPCSRMFLYIYIEAKSLSSPLSNYFIFLFFSFFPLFFRSTRIIKLTRSADH